MERFERKNFPISNDSEKIREEIDELNKKRDALMEEDRKNAEEMRQGLSTLDKFRQKEAEIIIQMEEIEKKLKEAIKTP